MNQLLLSPTDILFFRDGRPMSGSLAGHGAAWPLPTVTSAALHAALHRANLDNTHAHRRGRSGKTTEKRDRKFGSLVTAGPFPVIDNQWLFPRPLDAGKPESTKTTFKPLQKDFEATSSSLPQPLKYPAANSLPPSKEPLAAWWSQSAWNHYLDQSEADDTKGFFHQDSDFSDTESTYGIGIDPTTGTQDGERFYSAHYLRLKPGCKLGLLAEAQDKIDNDESTKRDLIAAVFPNSGTKTPVIVGGQQRLCTALRNHGKDLLLPKGKTEGFHTEKTEKDLEEKHLVKWVLLTPAIFPEIQEHKGGWLPSWVTQSDGQVMLKSGDLSRQPGEGRNTWRKRIAALPTISAKLVAAMVGKAVTVTGYAIEIGIDDHKPGPKPTHLAVPAGSVYYFEADSPKDAQALAAALNWHGSGDQTTIRNRRSTLMGEKGFGIGVCGTWQPHQGNRPNHTDQ